MFTGEGMLRQFFVLMIAAVLLSSCGFGTQPGVQIQESWVRAAKVSEISAEDLNKSCICDVKTATLSTNAYLTIQNSGGEADRLLKAESEGISRIEFRGTTPGSDLLTQKPLETIDLPGQGTISFASGSYAMLLMGMKKDLKAGETLTISLFFEKAGKIDATFAIREE
jgi:copper(I)-binding protein